MRVSRERRQREKDNKKRSKRYQYEFCRSEIILPKLISIAVTDTQMKVLFKLYERDEPIGEKVERSYINKSIVAHEW